jgi:hypothetical protein
VPSIKIQQLVNFVYNGAAHTLILKIELNVSLCMCLHTHDDDSTENFDSKYKVLLNFFIPRSYLHFISEIFMLALIQICICLIPGHFIQHCPSKNGSNFMKTVHIKHTNNPPGYMDQFQFKTYKPSFKP